MAQAEQGIKVFLTPGFLELCNLKAYKPHELIFKIQFESLKKGFLMKQVHGLGEINYEKIFFQCVCEGCQCMIKFSRKIKFSKPHSF